MDFFRISRYEYITDLSGTGARLYGGRWNSKGNSVLYTAGSRSLAALETLVHIPQKNLMDDLCIIRLSIPEKTRIKNIPLGELPDNWRSIPLNPQLQEIGNGWISEGRFLVMKVPSVVIPEEFNYLINPLHSDFRSIKSYRFVPFVFDNRLRAFTNKLPGKR